MSVDACSEGSGDWEEDEGSCPPPPGSWPEKKVKPVQDDPPRSDGEKTQAAVQEHWQLFLQNQNLFLSAREFSETPKDLESLRVFFPSLPLFSEKPAVNGTFPETTMSAGETFHGQDFFDGTTSAFLPTLGPIDPDLLILGMNGVNTSVEKALTHQAYLSSLIDHEAGIDFLYNHSSHIALDLFEIFLLNYQGISPKITTLLQERWQEFDRIHQDNPQKKILIFCHSQAALHVYNALSASSSDIRNRVIAVTIAPAKIIPKSLCYDSFNYASKRDFVHYGELLGAGFMDSRELGLSPHMEILLEQRLELVLLPPHPNAKGIDHEFQSPTFRSLLIKHLKEYLQNYGEYDQ